MKRARFVVASSLLFASLVLFSGCGDAAPPPVAPPSPPSPPPSPPPVTEPPPSAPVDPAPVIEGDVTVAFVRGMQIVVKRAPGAEFVAARLEIRGGVRNWTAENAGIEEVALSVATRGGTAALAKAPFSQKLASLGATIDEDAGADSSNITAKAPKASWDELFPIFADTFLAPALPASELEIVQQRMIANRRREMESGEGRIRVLARKASFAGHPYANRSVGTVESLTALKATDLAPHLATLRDNNRLVLIVVGDVDPTHVIDRAKSAFASVPRGPYVDTPMPPLHFRESAVVGQTFKLPTNYIESRFAGPAWNDADFTAMWLAMSVLRDRVWDEVRTKRNLSYAPQAWFDKGIAAPYAHLSVTAVDPSAAMKVMFAEGHRLQTELVPQKELDGIKAVMLSRYLQGHESVDGQAADLGESILLGGDWHRAQINIDRVRATTPEAVRDAAKKWFTNVQTAIVGDPGKLDLSTVDARRMDVVAH